MDPRVRLLLSSALMLFLELALIRWTAANIVHLGYFSNFVLLGSFLGVGIGFLRADRTDRDPVYFPVLLALLVAGVLRFPVTVDRSGTDLIFFTSLHTTGPSPWVVLPLVFLAVAGVMAGPGGDGRPLLRAAAAAGRLPARPARQPGWASSRSRRCRWCARRRSCGAASSAC